MDDMIRNFSIERINKHRSTMFDGKLSFLNKQHLHAQISTPQGLEDVSTRVINLLRNAYPTSRFLNDPVAVRRFVRVMKIYVPNLHDLAGLKQTKTILTEPKYKAAEAMAMLEGLEGFNSDVYYSVLTSTKRLLSTLAVDNEGFVNQTELQKGLQNIQDELHMSKKLFMTILRHATTALKAGISMPELITVLGPERIVKRIKRAEGHMNDTLAYNTLQARQKYYQRVD